MAGVTLDLVTHDDVQPALPAVHLEGRFTPAYGELAELIGECKWALRYADLGYRPAADILDIDRAGLLRDSKVHDLVAGLLTGEHRGDPA